MHHPRGNGGKRIFDFLGEKVAVLKTDCCGVAFKMVGLIV